ncbi:MAG TPA: cyanophycinase [Caulobacteraceae bacterium]|nr:cyanophycinase [Caulobacteraceae bacterium]
MSERGPLIVIGGHEDKEGDKAILCELVKRLDGGRLVVATVASSIPDEYFAEYHRTFDALGVSGMDELYVNERFEASSPEKLACLENAAGVFFTGGDQLRIASQIGDTPVEQAIRRIWDRGGVVAGTSAGASVMSEIMLVRGASGESHRIGDLQMSSGLGLIRHVVIDQHFAERGRIGRLMGAVAQNPRILGIGVDENTAFVLEGRVMRVIGEGAVYIVDGEGITHSNIAEADRKDTLSVHDVRLHVLSAGDAFDLDSRKPTPGKA